MATEPLEYCKILVPRVSIHCEGCKKKVKRVLQSVDGVYRCDIDARSNKVSVAVTGNVSADALLKRLRRSGKHAEQWPEQKQQPADTSQTPGETKKAATEPDKPGDTRTAEKPASGDSETHSAEQSNPKASPEAENPSKTAGVTAQPAQDGTESTSADADGVVEHATKEAMAEQCSNPKSTRKLQQPEEEKPVDTMVVVTAASAQSSHTCHLSPPVQQQQPPVHVLSYSVARPSASAASYYAAAPAARAPPPQELPYTYPPCCYYPQPSPYHSSWAPHASPACDSYSDLFSDDNANSCIVM